MYTGSLAAVSNRADWIETINVTDQSGGIPAVTEANIAVTGCGTSLTRSISGGTATYDDATGDLVFTFENTDMQNVRPGEYSVGIVLTIAGVQVQLFAGKVSVIDGVIA